MTALGYRGWLYARHGELAAAEAELRPLVEIGLEQGMPLAVSSGDGSCSMRCSSDRRSTISRRRYAVDVIPAC